MTNRIAKELILATALSAGFLGHAVTQESRYNTIVERNVFRLTSPPPPPPPPTNNEALDRNIELSGISNVNGHKKAWFIVKPKAGSKDGPLYVSLGENERQEFLEVQNISEAEGEVKVLNAGNPMILSFKNNGVKVVPGSMPPPAPVATAAMATPPNQLGANPYQPNQPNNNYGARPVTVMGGSTTPTSATGQPLDNGLRSIPSRSIRTPYGAQQNTAQPQSAAAVDPVTQRALMEIQQEHAKQTGQTLPPLPPLPQ